MNNMPIYYISDIHLEFQFEPLYRYYDYYGKRTKKERSHIQDICIASKVNEMLDGVDTSGILIVCGDVSHSPELTGKFYKILSKQWKGHIIAILGNHELWDGHPEGTASGYSPPPLSDIIKNLRKHINQSNCSMLENAVLLIKNNKITVFEEAVLSNINEDALTRRLAGADMVFLGGLGFSGRNEYFGATEGIYRAAVTKSVQDKALSDRFNCLHKKIVRCMGEKQLIVVTHSPVTNWDSSYTDNCIYVYGHTHRNAKSQKENNIEIYANNQIGYKPCVWKLKHIK